jgi:hypothetical protein
LSVKLALPRPPLTTYEYVPAARSEARLRTLAPFAVPTTLPSCFCTVSASELAFEKLSAAVADPAPTVTLKLREDWPLLSTPEKDAAMVVVPPEGGIEAAATVVVGALVALAEPIALVAVTETESELPTSVVVTVYEAVVAPAIGPHELPAELQRFHWYP